MFDYEQESPDFVPCLFPSSTNLNFNPQTWFLVFALIKVHSMIM